MSVICGARRSTRNGGESCKTGLASTAKVFRIEAEDHKIEERGATWMWHLWGTVGWSSFNQGWFKSRAVSSREQGHRVSTLGKATSLGFICEKRRMRVGLRSTYPFFSLFTILQLAILTESTYAESIPSQVSKPELAAQPRVRDPRVMDAARMYEKYFLNQMVKAMRGTVSYSDLQKPTMGEEIYRDQLDDQYVNSWTESGGIGLADMIHDELMGKAEMAKQRQEAYRSSRGKKRVPMTLTDRDVLHVRRLPNTGTASAGTETVLVSLAKTRQSKKEGREVVRLPWEAAVESVRSEQGKVVIGLRVAVRTVEERYVEMAFDGEPTEVTSGQVLKAGAIVGQLAADARGILIRQAVGGRQPANPAPWRESQETSTKVQEALNSTSKQPDVKDSGL